MNSPVKLWRNQKKVRDLVGKTGTVVSWTAVRVPPAGFSDQAPYVVALVSLVGGRKITAQLVDVPPSAEGLQGMKVITVIRRVMQPSTDGVIPYGIKVRPV